MSKYAREMETAVHDAGSCWIEPDGRFHPVPACGHERYARQHVFHIDQNDPNFWEGPGAVELEYQGWLHISFGTVRNPIRKPTQAQLDVFFDFASIVHLHGSDYHKENVNASLKRLLETT